MHLDPIKLCLLFCYLLAFDAIGSNILHLRFIFDLVLLTKVLTLIALLYADG